MLRTLTSKAYSSEPAGLAVIIQLASENRQYEELTRFRAPDSYL